MAKRDAVVTVGFQILQNHPSGTAITKLLQEVLGGLVVWELDFGGHCKPSVDNPVTQRSAAYITAASSYPHWANDVKLSAARVSRKLHGWAPLCNRPQFPPLPLSRRAPHSSGVDVGPGV